MLLTRFPLIFLSFLFIFISFFFKLNATDSVSGIDKNHCKPGMNVQIHPHRASFYTVLLSIPSHFGPEIELSVGGSFKITEIKGEFAKLIGERTGWLSVNEMVGWDGDNSTLNDICLNQTPSKKFPSIPVKYDTESIFALNADVSDNFYLTEDVTQNIKKDSTEYEKNLLKKAHFIAVSDYYSDSLPFASYGIILTSKKSPILNSEIDGAFEGVKKDLNISKLPINTTEFIDGEISYHFKEFKYYQKDLWEWLTGSTDTDYFQNFNNCFVSVMHDKPRNNKFITFFATYTSCHKNELNKKEIGNILKSIHFKDYKTPTVFYELNSVSQKPKTYQVNNKNIYCQNNSTKKVYETSKSDCIGNDTAISKNTYDVLLASKDNQKSSEYSNSLKLELDKKLPDWHFSKNEDYYILGLDDKGNKLVGSANFIDPYSNQPISRGNYYYLKDTYEETLSNSCFFTSTARTNKIVNNELRARGVMTLECNGKTLNGYWEQKGNLGTFVTNDKSIYGVFKTTKFDYLGAYLLPKNTYSLVTANSIYDTVRSGSYEDPWDEYEEIDDKIDFASRQFYQDDSNKTYLVNNQNNKSASINFDQISDTSEIKYVDADVLNVRETANGQWLSSLSKGEKVAILDKNGDSSWSKIISEDGQTGWVSSIYLANALDTSKDSISSFSIINQSNYLNIFNDLTFLKKIDLQEYFNKNIQSLPDCGDEDFYDQCFGIYELSNDPTFNNDCDFRYVGSFMNDTYEGFGSYEYYNCQNSNPSRFIGFFKNGKRSGLGYYDYGGSDFFVGYYSNDKALHGYYESSDFYYFGELDSINFKYSGLGTYVYINDSDYLGQSYIGEFDNGLRNGKGKYLYSDGSIQEGIYKDDKFIEEKIINTSVYNFNNIKNKYNSLKLEDLLVPNSDNDIYLYADKKDSNEYVQEKEEETKTDKITIENIETDQDNNKEPEINVAKKTFDDIDPSISCSKNEIYTKDKTALIDCKITDNNEVYKVFIDGNEVELRASRIKEKFPVVIGKSKLEVLAYDKAGNETKEIISVDREFSFASQIREFEPLKPGLISAPINKNRIAIIVGIKDYQDIPDTKYADKDAFTFIDYANETLGINTSNIKYFINDSAGFLDFKTIDRWLSTKINKNTEVFVFYSGHGANNNGQSLLLPSDFRTDLINDSSITKDGFLQQIADQNPKHIFAFFDACFSGLGREGETLIAGLRNISIVEEKAPFSNITIFNSASGAEFSSDFDEVGHGLFSYYLMKGLEGEADANSDQQISTSELHNYIYANVSEQSINLGPQQNPSLITNDDQIIVKW